jgi:hypothetical protein
VTDSVVGTTVFDLMEAFGLGNYGQPDEGGEFQTFDVARDDWAMEIMRGGVIVKMHIGGWTGRSKLKPQDLGISVSKDQEIREQQEALFRLGTKALCPENYTRKAESLRVMANQALKEFAVETIFGPFMTPETWAKFKERVYPLRDEYLALGEEIVSKYDEIREEMSKKYAVMAHEAWRRSRRRGPDEMAPDSSVAEYVANVMAAFPTRDAIASRFKFAVIPTIVPLPSLVAESLDRQNETLLEAAMRDDIKAHWHSQQKTIIDGFFQDVVGQVRNELYTVFQSAMNTMQRNGGTLHAKTKKALEKAMDIAQMKTPYDDPELMAAFARMRAELSKSSEKKGNKDVMQAVGDLTTVLRASLVMMEAGGRTGQDMDAVLEIPSFEEVTQARARLDLTDIEISPVVESAIRSGMGRSL